MSRYTGPSWKQSRRLGFSLTGTGKELARRNYVPGQHGPTVQNFQSTVCNWLRNKNFVSHTVWVKNNSVTCSYKLLKLKVEHLVSTLWFFWNVVLTTLFTVSVLQLLVVKHVNS